MKTNITASVDIIVSLLSLLVSLNVISLIEMRSILSFLNEINYKERFYGL